MSEFDRNYENNTSDSESSRYSYYYEVKDDKSHTKDTGKGKRRAAFFKKAGAITLSAVLFGGVAAGTFQGVNYLTGQFAGNETQQVNTTTDLLQPASSNMSYSGTMDVSSIVDAVMPSIVSITNKSVQEVQSIFSMFGYGHPSQFLETESAGSGIIVGQNDQELLIVTNYHVIQNATTLSASFIDNQVYEAKVKGTDPANDLAVIAIPLDSISESSMSAIAVAAVGDSDSLKVGEQVVAIGNALGYGQSVTTGIVSATDRSLKSSTQADTADNSPSYIQTDAAINPGNSGGALVNMKGEVIGINSAKLASTEVEGMGYAIPVSKVADTIESMMNQVTREKVSQEKQAVLGVSVTEVTDQANQMYGIPKGAYVSDVTENGAAEQAGIHTGDVIVRFDGRAVTDGAELSDILSYYEAGETVEIVVQSPGNGAYSERTVQATLGKAQKENAGQEASEEEQKQEASRASFFRW